MHRTVSTLELVKIFLVYPFLPGLSILSLIIPLKINLVKSDTFMVNTLQT